MSIVHWTSPHRPTASPTPTSPLNSAARCAGSARIGSAIARAPESEQHAQLGTAGAGIDARVDALQQLKERGCEDDRDDGERPARPALERGVQQHERGAREAAQEQHVRHQHARTALPAAERERCSAPRTGRWP